ncbi:hypothetical protein [Corallococcus exiguus]|uniref:hypothetical protein n=1 Tax=Corallococcus exiguus TaxID=83462 RepID=UPI0014943771|nr:hypothetical protein [Corallococcus exiguus]NPD26096.1 hypothetical protein [Corallococcus exiguus]
MLPRAEIHIDVEDAESKAFQASYSALYALERVMAPAGVVEPVMTGITLTQVSSCATEPMSASGGSSP